MTDQALDDLKAIWQYTPTVPAKGLPNRSATISSPPSSSSATCRGWVMCGPTCPTINDDQYRFWSVHSYFIAYHPDVKPIRIVRVVGGQQDFGRLFRRP